MHTYAPNFGLRTTKTLLCFFSNTTPEVLVRSRRPFSATASKQALMDSLLFGEDAAIVPSGGRSALGISFVAVPVLPYHFYSRACFHSLLGPYDFFYFGEFVFDSRVGYTVRT